MKPLAFVLLWSTGLVVLGLASLAIAGPNRGGTLVVHDAGINFTAAPPVPPVSAPPADCAGVDNEAPTGDPAHQCVWKVYAAFSAESSPRVKGLTWGIAGAGGIYVTSGGLPDPAHCFQIVQGPWPSPSSDPYYPSSIGQTFVFTQTSQMIECYWFGGYGYPGAVFSTSAHATQSSEFVDDATPPQTDAIAGFSGIGFGVPGDTQCPTIMGACCAETGACEQTRETDCVAPLVWHGDWESCDPNPCPPPPLGACCYHCGGICVVRDELSCGHGGGNWWMGPGTVCEPDPCQPAPGACCAPDGSCRMTTAGDCPAPGGWHCYRTCESNPCPGACCSPINGTCYLGDEAFCYPPQVWHAEWTTCQPNPCPQPELGACCNPENGYCDLVAEEYCSAPSTWNPDWLSCNPNPCPQPQLGACCHPGYGSCILTAEEYCLPPSTWNPDWLSCQPNPCPQPQFGACCSPESGSCMLYGEDLCLAPNIWHPEWLSCIPNPCPDTRGACCDPEWGWCSLEPEFWCSLMPGVWHPEWTSCDPNPCPLPSGSCCYPNGDCLVTSPDDCTGFWMLRDDCAPNLCPQPSGACCFGDGTCQVLEPADCADSQGQYQGNASNCIPNLCPVPVPTERTSWGRVKNFYR